MNMQDCSLRDIAVGDVLEVSYPHGERPTFTGEVTEVYASALKLTSVEIHSITGEPTRTYRSVTAEDLKAVGAQQAVVTLRPEYAVWSAGGLMSFGLEQPEIPQGLTLHELLRHNRSQFILAFNPASGEWNPARYRMPFCASERIIRQHVTVFALNNGATLERYTPDGPASSQYRHLLPENVDFIRIDTGYVLGTGARVFGINSDASDDVEGQLAMGYHAGPAGGLHWHNLRSGKFFAIETSVLERAGIDIPDSP
jgi:hypothetical protein